MHVCMYVCMHVCMYVCMYARMYIHMCACVQHKVSISLEFCAIQPPNKMESSQPSARLLVDDRVCSNNIYLTTVLDVPPLPFRVHPPYPAQV